MLSTNAPAQVPVNEDEPIILWDSAEQTPLIFFNLKAEKATLPLGDYTIKGLEHEIIIERKTESDFLGSIGRNRLDFMEKMQKMTGFRRAFLLIECTYEYLMLPHVYSKMHPNSIKGTLASIQAKYNVHVVFFRSREQASEWIETLFRLYWKERKGNTQTNKLGRKRKANSDI